MGKQPKFDVVSIDGGTLLRGSLHRVAAETLAYWWNHALYDRGPYCEVRPASNEAESVAAPTKATGAA